MENKAVLRKALENLNSKFIREGQICIGLNRFSNYRITDSENDLSFALSGNYYGVDCFEHWEGIYYDQERDLFFYVGMSSPDKFSNITSAFEINGDLLDILTTELKVKIREASLSKSRICVDYTEFPNFLELPS
jgi:hypothetical protein